MKNLDAHHTNDLNKIIEIHAYPNHDNSCALYDVRTVPAFYNVSLEFHEGDLSNGPNGITNEVLLAILIDRLERFQASKLACDENQTALSHCRLALRSLAARTRDRIKRGVEGTQEP